MPGGHNRYLGIGVGGMCDVVHLGPGVGRWGCCPSWGSVLVGVWEGNLGFTQQQAPVLIVPLAWWYGFHCFWTHPLVRLVVST